MLPDPSYQLRRDSGVKGTPGLVCEDIYGGSSGHWLSSGVGRACIASSMDPDLRRDDYMDPDLRRDDYMDPDLRRDDAPLTQESRSSPASTSRRLRVSRAFSRSCRSRTSAVDPTSGYFGLPRAPCR